MSQEVVRNLTQSRDGGRDLDNTQPFCVEVKRCERLALKAWWIQAKKSCTDEYHIPVVMFRQNRQDWEFLLPASMIGVEKGFIRLDHLVFKRWAHTFITNMRTPIPTGTSEIYRTEASARLQL